ncbi:MAG: hypothetical protein ACTSRA_19390 [Promethearchaeota archaeon]
MVDRELGEPILTVPEVSTRFNPFPPDWVVHFVIMDKRILHYSLDGLVCARLISDRIQVHLNEITRKYGISDKLD